MRYRVLREKGVRVKGKLYRHGKTFDCNVRLIAYEKEGWIEPAIVTLNVESVVLPGGRVVQ